MVYYGGLQFGRKIGHYYKFALPEPISDHADFKGTSGTPITDKGGNVVSLVIYGIALSDFVPMAEVLVRQKYEFLNGNEMFLVIL